MSTSAALQTCPCQINPASETTTAPLLYKDCCQPYHDSVLNKEADKEADKTDSVQAETAERLMRTRYSAFVLIKLEYIVKTTLPAQQSLLDVIAIEEWATKTDWAGLEVVEHRAKLGKRHAQVEFKAFYTTADAQQAAHHDGLYLLPLQRPITRDALASH